MSIHFCSLLQQAQQLVKFGGMAFTVKVPVLGDRQGPAIVFAILTVSTVTPSFARPPSTDTFRPIWLTTFRHR
jgi:hypothetical protein